MTEEQIKQNACEYASIGRGAFQTYEEYAQLRDAFIAGAHSRDEEIERLKEIRDEYLYGFKKADKELQNLRNPWISVKDKKYRPAVGQQILIEYLDGKYEEHGLTHFVVNYQGVSTFETFKAIRWMSIPY